MTTGLFLDHAAKMAIFVERFDISKDYLALSLAVLGHPEFPTDYDIVTCFSKDASFVASLDEVVRHAMDRERLQREKSGHKVRSVMVNMPDDWPVSSEIWSTFFQGSDAKLEILQADSLEDAYKKLGRGTPAYLNTLSSEAFYEALLEESPLAAQR